MGWAVEDHNDVRLLCVLQADLRATAALLGRAKLGRLLSYFTWVLEAPNLVAMCICPGEDPLRKPPLPL